MDACQFAGVFFFALPLKQSSAAVMNVVQKPDAYREVTGEVISDKLIDTAAHEGERGETTAYVIHAWGMADTESTAAVEQG